MEINTQCGAVRVGHTLRVVAGSASPRKSRREHLSTGQPYRAGPKAGETAPEDALKLRYSGPASAALGPALWGCPVDRCVPFSQIL